MSSPEQLPSTAEVGPSSVEVAGEQLEKLQSKHESTPEKGQEQSAERAKTEALETAISVEKRGAEQVRAKTHTPRRTGTISKKEKTASYKRHMKQIQTQMNPVSRAFSKFIHSAPVEKTSEIVGATVARPNAILSGALFAFLLVLGVYLVAKSFGYPLSGFETIGAFIIGWIIGLVYDYLKVLITGKR